MAKQQNNSNQLGIITVLIILFLQISMMPWFLEVLIHWSDGEESTYGAFFLIFLLSPILLVFLVNNLKVRLFQIYQKKEFLLGCLVVLALLDFIIYGYFSRLFLAPEGLPSGWTALEDQPAPFITLWGVVAFLGVIPSCLGILITRIETSADLALNSHLAFLGFFLLMALRWGGSWAAPQHHLVYNLALVPVLYIVQLEPIDAPSSIPERNQNLAILYLFGFWLAAFELFVGLQLNRVWLYIIPAIGHGLLYVFFKSRYEKEAQGLIRREFALGLWVALVIVTILTTLTNLWSIFLENWEALLIVGMLLAAFLPEIFFSTRVIRERTLVPRFFYSSYTFLAGFLSPILMILFEALSTYIIIGFIVISLVIGALGIWTMGNERSSK